MARPICKITKDVVVGIYDSEYSANIYADKIIVTTPYIKWIDNSGSLDTKKNAIRDKKIIDKVIAVLNDDCEDSAWDIIGRELYDEHLIQM